MTSFTTTPATSSNDSRGDASDRSRMLRMALRVNAGNSALCGIALLAGATTFADWLGTGHPGWIRLVGLGLLPFAAWVAWISIGDAARLRRETPAVIGGDIAWVVASVVTLVLGWYDGAGIALVIAMAVVVEAFATAQFIGWRRLPARH